MPGGGLDGSPKTAYVREKAFGTVKRRWGEKRLIKSFKDNGL
jgi:hypothetical protein